MAARATGAREGAARVVIAYGFVRAVVGRSAAVLLCVAGVPVLVVTLVHAFFGVPLSAYRPIINDEVAYWHQALTFTRAGFNGGYYTLGEVTNPSGLTPFGPHGPGFAVLYGTAGSLFGWYRHSVVILNLIAIGAAAWIWASLTRASIPRLLLGAAMLLTFWHMLYWAPTGMQESLHHAGAIAIAGCFAAVLGPYRRWWVIGFGWVVLAVLAFVRPSWLILFPLWAIATTRSSSRRIIAATVVASIADRHGHSVRLRPERPPRTRKDSSFSVPQASRSAFRRSSRTSPATCGVSACPISFITSSCSSVTSTARCCWQRPSRPWSPCGGRVRPRA